VYIHVRLTQCIIVIRIDTESQRLDLVIVAALSIDALDGLRGSAVLLLDEIAAIHHDPGHIAVLVVLQNHLQFRIEAGFVEENALFPQGLHTGPAFEPVGQIHPGH